MTTLQFQPIQIDEMVAERFRERVAQCGGTEVWLRREVERIAALPEGVSLKASQAFERVLQDDRRLLERLAD